MSVVGMIVITWLPLWTLYIMIATVSALSGASKLLQLVAIVRTQNDAIVRPLTWALGTCTATVRILTGIVQTKDPFMVLLATQAALLNGAIGLSAAIFKPKPM
ncbi:hypothetical protein LSH36_756g01022 [Paralvinella palmiformis]|uniref:Uncharacterized protein n=1 Tax=Paralvinella palmiformis TaxID=53620 RepID=A0AAD9J1S6_9ANNE|nr:hypothetical protein LSH36_756g01022 [Paralvinella palmiformis]